MKRNTLLAGVAMLAGLVMAVPVWAQGPPPTGRHYGGFSGDNPNPGFGPMSTEAGVPPPAPPAPPAATAPRHHARRHARAHPTSAPLEGASASQLNQQELARIQGGAAPPAAPMPAAPMQQ